jgi:rhodanese-related sulfurtransferase
VSIKSVSPSEAQALLAEGAVYVDVRSEPEFEAGHPPGALNIPLLHAGIGGMTPNPEFAEVMQRCFGRGEQLIMGCRSGQRSLRAGEMLVAAGYLDVSNLFTGWEGSRDAFGQMTPGWRLAGLPVEAGSTPGGRYADAKQRTPR